LNSYTLETLSGEPLPGSFSARRLRRFIPREGTKLAEEQKLREECGKEKLWADVETTGTNFDMITRG
jgi:hypothetical protein